MIVGLLFMIFIAIENNFKYNYTFSLKKLRKYIYFFILCPYSVILNNSTQTLIHHLLFYNKIVS